jgi:hypothetical protein
LTSTPEQFFAEARERFESAAACSGVVERRFRVAERHLRLRFAGRALEDRLTPAIEHLATLDDGTPEITVCLFDTATTGAGLRAGWDASAFRPRGEIVGFNTERYRTVFQQGADAFLMLDRQQREAVYWVSDAGQVPYWERSFPLRTAFHWWFEDLPLQPVHAAAVGFADGGVLITGPSGCGKSTTALACLNSELLYAGDDYVLVQHAPSPHVYCLYGTAKLEPENLVRFPALEPFLDNPDHLDREKALVFLRTWMPGKLNAGFPIRALVTPRVTGRRNTLLIRAGALEAVRALAPTTLYHLPGAERKAFAKIAALVRQLPCYVLEVGTDLPQIPVRIMELLR